MAKRLYRSKKERMIAGICGGVAEYFNIDPVIVRLIFVVLALGGGRWFATSHSHVDYRARRTNDGLMCPSSG